MIVWLAEDAQAADVAGHIAQAKFFLKKSWYEDASKELEAAVALPDGAIDPEAWYLLATVRYALLDVAAASEAAERAQTYARTDDQLYQAASYATFLHEQFGTVEIVPPYPGFVGRVEVAAVLPPIDPELRAYLARLEAKLGKKQTFPLTIALPVGDYELCGERAVIEPGREVVAHRSAADLGGSGLASAQLAKFEFGGGLSTSFGRHVSHYLPGPTFHVAVSQPMYGAIGGVFVDFAPRWYRTVDAEILVAPQSWSLGARLGVELPNTGAVAIRPSIGWRVAQVPALGRNCVATDGAFECAEGGPAELVVYSTGIAHAALAELSLDYIDRQRIRTLGIGVKIIGEAAFGRLPASGNARMPDGQGIDFTVIDEDRGFSAMGVRFMPNFSVAF